MPGYSPRSLPDKLGIKPGSKVAVLGGPDGLIEGSRWLVAGTDLLVAFFTERQMLEKRWPALTPKMAPAGAIWVAWPKKASGVPTDLSDNVVREVVLPTGWVDTKVCAIDDTWSGLKCVLRVKLRPSLNR
jgi:hypothetical protein